MTGLTERPAPGAYDGRPAAGRQTTASDPLIPVGSIISTSPAPGSRFRPGRRSTTSSRRVRLHRRRLHRAEPDAIRRRPRRQSDADPDASSDADPDAATNAHADTTADANADRARGPSAPGSRSTPTVSARRRARSGRCRVRRLTSDSTRISSPAGSRLRGAADPAPVRAITRLPARPDLAAGERVRPLSRPQ